MEMGESVAVGGLLQEMKEKCPFQQPSAEVGSEEPGEEDDDLPDAQLEQDNSGSTLGKNLKGGSAGRAGTTGGPCSQGEYRYEMPKPEARVTVLGAGSIPTGVYPVKCAAHHLIPGNGSLGQSDLYDFLGPEGSGELTNNSKEPRKRKKIKIRKRQYGINAHIGYNINGSHNGVWLPGNYAIRAGAGMTPVEGLTWSDLEQQYASWQFHYVAAASRVMRAQFHDTHEHYSERVLKLTNKISGALRSHLRSGCDCSAQEQVPPPFVVKRRLYAVTRFLRGELSQPIAGRRPRWYTSGWIEKVYRSTKTLREFAIARAAAEEG